MIRVGDVEIDISGSQKEVDAQMMNIREGEDWSTAIARVRSVRETAIAAAMEAAKKNNLPERGSAFRSLIENSSLMKNRTRFSQPFTTCVMLRGLMTRHHVS